LKGNQLEIQYLNLCDDEVEEDFENIVKSQKLKVEIEELVTIQQQFRRRIISESFENNRTHSSDVYEANFLYEFAEKAND
jgi:para-aminobenzoate synthetase component 1